uniref:(northern house mosquito) hypothetical protein n=1 Tax=Culex pipiens TaxID=7175 RepID=A0A8D8A2X2_CULPI
MTDGSSTPTSRLCSSALGHSLLKKEIRQLKNNKAIGKDWLSGVLFKYEGEIRQIPEQFHAYNVPTYYIFIDIQAAYDTIDHEQLWQIMQENGFPDKLTRLINNSLTCHVSFMLP